MQLYRGVKYLSYCDIKACNNEIQRSWGIKNNVPFFGNRVTLQSQFRPIPFNMVALIHRRLNIEMQPVQTEICCKYIYTGFHRLGRRHHNNFL